MAGSSLKRKFKGVVDIKKKKLEVIDDKENANKDSLTALYTCENVESECNLGRHLVSGCFYLLFFFLNL